MDTQKNKVQTNEESKILSDKLKDVFKGGVKILNPEKLGEAMENYYKSYIK